MTANLDAASFDRIAWLRHLSIRLLKAEAGTSVLIRRALMAYADHMEQLLASHTPEQLDRERGLLSSAARGDICPLSEDDLLAVPLRPFTAIQEEAKAAAADGARGRLKAELETVLEQWDNRARRGLGANLDG